MKNSIGRSYKGKIHARFDEEGIESSKILISLTR